MIKISIKFILFLLIININANDNNCFELNSETISLSQDKTTLTIKGTGEMCDCLSNEYLNYQETVTKIIFQNEVTSIGMKCFSNYQKLTDIQFGNKIERIEEYAFYNSSLKELTIPSKTNVVEEFAFAENKELEKIEFDESEYEVVIQNYVFANCNLLKNVTLPNNLIEKYLIIVYK